MLTAATCTKYADVGTEMAPGKLVLALPGADGVEAAAVADDGVEDAEAEGAAVVSPVGVVPAFSAAGVNCGFASFCSTAL